MVDGWRADLEDPFPSLEDSESLHPIEPLNRARSLRAGCWEPDLCSQPTTQKLHACHDLARPRLAHWHGRLRRVCRMRMLGSYRLARGRGRNPLSRRQSKLHEWREQQMRRLSHRVGHRSYVSLRQPLRDRSPSVASFVVREHPRWRADAAEDRATAADGAFGAADA